MTPTPEQQLIAALAELNKTMKATLRDMQELRGLLFGLETNEKEEENGNENEPTRK